MSPSKFPLKRFYGISPLQIQHSDDSSTSPLWKARLAGERKQRPILRRNDEIKTSLRLMD